MASAGYARCTYVYATGRRCDKLADANNHAQRCKFHATLCDNMYRDYKEWLEGEHEENRVPVGACRAMRPSETLEQYRALLSEKVRAANGAIDRISEFDRQCLAAHEDFDPTADVGGRALGHADRLDLLRKYASACEHYYATAATQARLLRERRAMLARRSAIAKAAREHGLSVADMLAALPETESPVHPPVARGEALLPTLTPPREPSSAESGVYRARATRRSAKTEPRTLGRALKFDAEDV